MYRERMMGYYPLVIQSILEFQGIIDSEYPEFEQLSVEKEKVLENAYLLTMDETRIGQWESVLNIRPIEGSTIEDRRDTIIARIRGQGKLNSEMINTIVSTFTGGTAISWVEDGTLYVEIEPPPGNKQYLFENVEQELAKKVPAHLGFKVSRNYYTWEEAKTKCVTWGDVKSYFDKWENVLLFIPFTRPVLTITTQPQHQAVAVDTEVQFTIVAENAVSYQWYYCNNGINWWTTGMPGAQTPTLTVVAASGRNGYQYRCVVRDAYGNELTSDAATLTITNN